MNFTQMRMEQEYKEAMRLYHKGKKTEEIQCQQKRPAYARHSCILAQVLSLRDIGVNDGIGLLF